jgi:hypothetical protein
MTQGAGLFASYVSLTTLYPPEYDVAGFDWLTRFEFFRTFDGDGKSHSVTHGGRTYEVKWKASPPRLLVRDAQVDAELDLTELMKNARRYLDSHPGAKGLPQAMLTQEVATNGGVVRVYIEDLSMESPEDPRVLHFKADVLFRRLARK